MMDVRADGLTWTSTNHFQIFAPLVHCMRIQNPQPAGLHMEPPIAEILKTQTPPSAGHPNSKPSFSFDVVGLV
jgi:hypothetical protein